MSEEKMTEEEVLKRLREAPDGFAKAWGYAMYGALKALEVASKMKEKVK